MMKQIELVGGPACGLQLAVRMIDDTFSYEMTISENGLVLTLAGAYMESGRITREGRAIFYHAEIQ